MFKTTVQINKVDEGEKIVLMQKGPESEEKEVRVRVTKCGDGDDATEDKEETEKHSAAYEEGYEAGHEAGYEKGFEEGYEKGYEEGFEKGQEAE